MLLKPLTGTIHVIELDLSQDAWIFCAQQQCLAKEIKEMSNGSGIIKSPLKHLSPYLDKGILRVGGRLEYSSKLFSRNYPYISSH